MLYQPLKITEHQWNKEDNALLYVQVLTYNHESYIKECIEGILMQETTFPVHIVVFEDCSTDKTAEILKGYKTKHPKLFTLYLQPVNTYGKDIRQKALQPWYETAKKGKYIAKCEGDDYWTDPLKLQKQVDFLEGNTDCSLTCHTVGVDIYGSNKIEARQYITEDRYLSNNEIITAHGHLTPTLSCVFRSQYLVNLPSWVLKAPVGDIPLTFFLMMQGRVYSFSNSMGVYRSELPGSWSMSKKKAKLSIRLKHRIKYNAFIQGFNKYSSQKYTDELNIHLGKRNIFISLIINTASFFYKKLYF